jgi:hypothetical protein
MPESESNSVLIATDLFTRDGGFVATVNVPPFTPPAEVLQWGSRYFVYDKIDGRYYEGLLYFVSPLQDAGE